MNPLDLVVGLAVAISVGGVAVHYQFIRARKHRIHLEADAFGGRIDDAENR